MYRISVRKSLIKHLALAGVLVFLAAGCGGTRGIPSTPNPAKTESVLPAWQQKWEKTLAAAKQEGTLTIYGNVTPRLREALAAFQSKYGITIDFVTAGAREIGARYDRERNAGLNLADIFHMSEGTGITVMKPRGYLAPVESYLILPETREPKFWPQGHLPFIDRDKTILMLASTYTSYVAINTDLIKEGQLKSYRDLLKPEWKGEIVLFNPALSGAALGWVIFLIKDIYGLDGTKEYLRQFAANTPVVTKNSDQQIEWVARGKYPIAAGASSAVTSDYKSRGTPVSLNRFVEGGSMNAGSGSVMIPLAPPHPNATSLYINWLLTEEGQAAFAKGMAAPPVRVGVKVEGIDPAKVPLSGEKVFVYDEDHTLFGPEAINIVNEVLGGLLK